MAYEAADRSFSNSNNAFSNDLGVSIREIFYAYNNRDSTDNRSAQRHLGPSEIGTPCDRRLAMELLGVPHVNPGGDGYAAWLGTQGHRGMADIYEWADGRSGRFAVETKLSFPSKLVPRGTGDLLDRKLRAFVDWKFMGFNSIKSLRMYGPKATYRVQIHTYAGGAVERGEKVEHVAIVGMPRQGYSLDEMYVWSEPYDPSIYRAALERVERIGAEVATGLGHSPHGPGGVSADVAKSFAVAKDCDYCPFHLAGSSDLGHACNGRA